MFRLERVWVVKPGRLQVSEYVPTGRSGSTYVPLLMDVAVRNWPVEDSRAVIVAPSMNAPLWSVTVPLMLARPSWPHRGRAAQKPVARHRNRVRRLDGMKL